MDFVLGGEEMSLIKKMELEALKYSWVVSLAQWVPWYPIPDSVMEFLIEKIRKWQTNRYSIVPGIPQLREQVALRYYKKYWVEVDHQTEIIITAWAIQAISAILLTILWEWDEVILLDPCYASYKWCVRITKANPVYVPLNDKLDLDMSAIKKAINNNTKAIVISNPNNPTWSIFTLDKIRKLLDYIKWNNVLFVMDEVYDEFLYDGNKFDSAIKLYDEYKHNLLVINSWSKTFGMTGWRVWYMVWEQRYIQEIIKVHDSLITCAPVHSQWAALATFEIFDERTDDVRKKLQERRDYTVQELSKLERYIEFNVPWAAYFVFPKFKYTDDDYNECLNILHDQKLVLVPWGWFWNKWIGRFRMCFWRDFDDLREGISRLGKYFKKRV